MNLLPGTVRLTADGVVGASGQPMRVYSVHLISGGSASTCTLENGTTSSGTIYAQIDGTASMGVTINFAGGLLFPNGCFLDADANITSCVIVCSSEN